MDDEDDDEEFEQGTNKNFGASTRIKKPISHRGVLIRNILHFGTCTHNVFFF